MLNIIVHNSVLLSPAFISDATFGTFVFLGAVRIVDINGELIINPTKQQLQQGSLNLVVASTEQRIGRHCTFRYGDILWFHHLHI